MDTTYRHQSGVALLTITILLLLVATLGTLSIGRVGLVEQQQVGRDVRSKEVYSAAIGGLEFGKDFFADNFNGSLTFSDGACGGCTAGDGISERGDTATVAMNNLTLGVDTYSYLITYTLLTDMNEEAGMPVIVQIAATATAVNDSQVTKTIREDILVGQRAITGGSSEGDFNVLEAPPIVVEDCTIDFTGGPDVYLPGPYDIGIGSTNGLASGLGEDNCIDPGHLDQFECDDDACMSSTQLSAVNRKFITPQQSLWHSIFGDVTMEDLLELEAQQPGRLWIVDDQYPKYSGQPALQNTNTWGGSTYGSADEPIILIIDKDRVSNNCLGMAGNTVIYGLVYYETEEASPSTCSMNGWGQVEIHGTLAKAGDMFKLNANTKIFGNSLNFGNTVGGAGGSGTEYDCGLCLPLYSEIPGTWRDY